MREMRQLLLRVMVKARQRGLKENMLRKMVRRQEYTDGWQIRRIWKVYPCVESSLSGG